MWNPIAIVAKPSKVFFLGFGLMALFLVLGVGFTSDFEGGDDEVSVVELLR
jgi:hypothetical protein